MRTIRLAYRRWRSQGRRTHHLPQPCGIEQLEQRLLLSAATPGGDCPGITHPSDEPVATVNIDQPVWAIGAGIGLLGAYFDDADFSQLKLRRTDAAVDFKWADASPYASIDADTFTIRWTGQVQALTSELYTFDVLADDAVRLWVDGELLIDTWVGHAHVADAAQVALHAGQKYDITLEYLEDAGDAAVQLVWSTPTIHPSVIPRTQLYNGGNAPGIIQSALPGAGEGNGLLGEYFDNARFTDLKLTRTDAQVNFHWGEAAPDVTLGADTFSVRWTGQVQPLTSEVYTFHTYSDDGVRLWVDGKLLIDAWDDHAAKLDSARIALKAGRRYDIRLEYYDTWGTAVAQLHWSTPTINRVAIPQSQLYSTEEPTEVEPPTDTTGGTDEPEVVSTIPGFDTRFGHGLVDAAAAIGAALDVTLGPVTGDEHDWAANMVSAPEVWAAGFTGAGIIVAVVDSGVDYTHPDLDDNIWTNSGEIAWNGVDDDSNGFIDDIHGWDFVDRDARPIDLHGHGTHVAGTIAAERNGFGVTGIAYDALIMPVRVLDVRGSGHLSNVAAGVRYAADNGAHVINLSLGSRTDSSLLREAIAYAESLGVLIVSAAGNSGAASPVYPAAYATQYGVAVGAVTELLKMPGFSSRAGSKLIDYIVAPGVQVYSTRPRGEYDFDSGTSMAAPHVAAIAALLRQALPSAEVSEIKSLLTSTANSDIVTV